MEEHGGNNEWILCAAIKYNDLIISGHRHGDCYETLFKLKPESKNETLEDCDPGFLTSNNRFVSREEAWLIAEANNQIKFGYEASKKPDPDLIAWLEYSDEDYKQILISENLY